MGRKQIEARLATDQNSTATYYKQIGALANFILIIQSLLLTQYPPQQISNTSRNITLPTIKACPCCNILNNWLQNYVPISHLNSGN